MWKQAVHTVQEEDKERGRGDAGRGDQEVMRQPQTKSQQEEEEQDNENKQDPKVLSVNSFGILYIAPTIIQKHISTEPLFLQETCYRILLFF